MFGINGIGGHHCDELKIPIRMEDKIVVSAKKL